MEAFPGRSFSLSLTRTLHAVSRRDGLVVITGAAGCGKTTLRRCFTDALSAPRLVSVIADPGSADVFEHVARDARTAGSADLQGRQPAPLTPHDQFLFIQRVLLSTAASGTVPVLVIDDGHRLTPRALEQIRFLSNLESDQTTLLQIVLIGRPELEALLTATGGCRLDERVACHIRLEPLGASEVSGYVQHRLRTARRETDPARIRSGRFSSSAIRMLARASRGVPRALDALVDRSLDIAGRRGASSVTGPIILESARQLDLAEPMFARYAVLVACALAAIAAVSLAFPFARRKQPSRPVKAPAAVAMPSPAPAHDAAPSDPPRDRAAPADASSDTYVVVVASFRRAVNAMAVVAQLERLGFSAVDEESSSNWHVVTVGPYTSFDEAVTARRRLAAQHFADAVVRVRRR